MSSDRRTHRCNRRGIVLRTEDGRPSHESISTGFCNLTNIVRFDTSIDLQPYCQLRSINNAANRTQLVQRTRDKPLVSETRIHRHHQDKIDPVQYMVEYMDRGRGIQHHTSLTSAFTAIAPDGIAGWQGQLVFFAIATTALFIMGRTLFRRMRENVDEHPTLNKRMAGTLGQRGVVADDFTGGIGRVKLGDTEWSAQSIDGANLTSGVAVIVEATEGNILKVRPA